MSNPADSPHASPLPSATDTPGTETSRTPATDASAPSAAAPMPSGETAPEGAPVHHRAIRSYVLRRSHFSNAQRDAFERLMPVFGLRFQDAPLDYTAAFGRTAPVVLEIGFGMGDTTAEIAANAPDINFIAIDVHTPGVGALLKLVEQKGLQNLRVMEHDATQVMASMIAPGSLDGIHVFFPDPWPKARHHKRRLIQTPFVAQLISRLKPGGYLHLATDWQDYADQMAEVLAGFDTLSEQAPGPMPSPSLPCPRPSTRFERRGERLGHGITDLVRYRRA
ncbi:MAG: tRNA (guanosine(46)-N7)-methyltransferase TrmB [Lautropia sp.]|nr:tRNA (guanosine(46)-N7)-methyltransferase TrmB [Lautropia sp.]